jgi:hypothetical protein
MFRTEASAFDAVLSKSWTAKPADFPDQWGNVPAIRDKQSVAEQACEEMTAPGDDDYFLYVFDLAGDVGLPSDLDLSSDVELLSDVELPIDQGGL